MKMTKQQWLGIVRHLLTILSGLLTSYGFVNIGGLNPTDVAGILLAIATTIWGIVDKSTNSQSAWYSLFRHILSLFAGLFIFLFPQKSETVQILMPTLLSVLAIIFSVDANQDKNQLDKSKLG